MLANLFKDISVASVIKALGFSLILLIGYVVLYPSANPSFSWGSLTYPVSPVLYDTCLVISVLLTAWWFNQRVNQLGFLKHNLQLTPIFTLLILPIITEDSKLEYLMILPAGLFIISRMIGMAWGASHRNALFDSGVITGLITLLVPESLIFVVISWVGILAFSNVYFRAFLMPVTGVLAIWSMLFSYFYLFEGMPLGEQASFVFNDLKLTFDQTELSDYGWKYIPLALLLFPALLQTVQVYTKANVYKKQVFSFMLMMLLIILVSGVFVENNLGLLLWVCFPFAILLSNLVHYSKKWWSKDLVYLGLLGFLIFGLL